MTNAFTYIYLYCNNAGGRGRSDLEIFTDILEYDADLEAWKKVGDMQLARYRHAAAVIYGDFSDLCN